MERIPYYYNKRFSIHGSDRLVNTYLIDSGPYYSHFLFFFKGRQGGPMVETVHYRFLSHSGALSSPHPGSSTSWPPTTASYTWGPSSDPSSLLWANRQGSPTMAPLLLGWFYALLEYHLWSRSTVGSALLHGSANHGKERLVKPPTLH